MRGRALAAALVAAALTLTACGSADEDVRKTIADNYELVTENGDYAAYHSDDDVLGVAGTIESTAEAGRDHNEGSERYLGYEETMVHISPSPSGGSDIEVTDVRDGYDRWGPVIVPVWGLFGGGYRSGFSGGGSGFGK